MLFRQRPPNLGPARRTRNAPSRRKLSSDHLLGREHQQNVCVSLGETGNSQSAIMNPLFREFTAHPFYRESGSTPERFSTR